MNAKKGIRASSYNRVNRMATESAIFAHKVTVLLHIADIYLTPESSKKKQALHTSMGRSNVKNTRISLGILLYLELRNRGCRCVALLRASLPHARHCLAAGGRD